MYGRYDANVFCHHFTLDDNQNLNEESDDKFDKDKFIELAQEALEYVKMEEERTSVFQELFEALIIQTGAPKVPHVILEQFRSQDNIGKVAENLHRQQYKLTSNCDIHILKEPTCIEEDIKVNLRSVDRMMLVSECLWKFFKILSLSSVVCLVYHFIHNAN